MFPLGVHIFIYVSFGKSLQGGTVFTVSSFPGFGKFNSWGFLSLFLMDVGENLGFHFWLLVLMFIMSEVGSFGWIA